MQNDTSGTGGFKRPAISPNTSDDQAELLRRIQRTESPDGPPRREDPYMTGRQQRYAERAPEAHPPK